MGVPRSQEHYAGRYGAEDTISEKSASRRIQELNVLGAGALAQRWCDSQVLSVFGKRIMNNYEFRKLSAIDGESRRHIHDHAFRRFLPALH